MPASAAAINLLTARSAYMLYLSARVQQMFTPKMFWLPCYIFSKTAESCQRLLLLRVLRILLAPQVHMAQL